MGKGKRRKALERAQERVKLLQKVVKVNKKGWSLNPELEEINDAQMIEDLLGMGFTVDEIEEYQASETGRTVLEWLWAGIDFKTIEEWFVGIKLPNVVKRGAKKANDSWNAGANPHGWPPGQTGYATTYVPCGHKGDKLIYEFDGKQLYAASNAGMDEYSGKWDLIIDLAGVVRIGGEGFIKGTSAKRFNALKNLAWGPAVPKSELLRLDWPDMGVPGVWIEFWEAVWAMLPAKTCICCQGGHGRTGSCLVSLMIATGQDYYTALEHVRKEHCHKAVENLKQEEYLHEIYVDKLKYALEDKDSVLTPDAKFTMEEELKYALDHKPAIATTKASKEYKGVVPGKAVTLPWQQGGTGSGPATPTGHAPGDFDGQYVRRVNGKAYVKECTDPKCQMPDCRIESHLAWIEGDFGLVS